MKLLITSVMGRLVLVVLCSLLFATAVNSRVLVKEKPDKGNTKFSTFMFYKEWKISKKTK